MIGLDSRALYRAWDTHFITYRLAFEQWMRPFLLRCITILLRQKSGLILNSFLM